MTRVLHLIPGLTGGGAERQLTLLAVAQAEMGYEVHIGIQRTDVPSVLRGHASIHIHILPTNGNHDPLLFVRIRRLILQTRADVVQTWLMMMDMMGGAAALATGRAWILSERSQKEQYPSNWKNSARARLARSARSIVANSPGGVAYWAERGLSRDQLVCIPNAVDASAITDAPAADLPAAFRGRPLVLFVGRLSEEKMPFVLLDSLAKALPAQDAVALLCGVGPLDAEMRTAITKANAGDRIFMAGHRSDVFGLMRAATVCVAISRYEGNPNVALEAMVAGCPLIVSDIPAYRQLLDDSGALFVPVNDSNATALAIAVALSDTAAARQRAEHARSTITELSPRNMAEALGRVYDRVLSKA